MNMQGTGGMGVGVTSKGSNLGVMNDLTGREDLNDNTQVCHSRQPQDVLSVL